MYIDKFLQAIVFNAIENLLFNYDLDFVFHIFNT